MTGSPVETALPFLAAGTTTTKNVAFVDRFGDGTSLAPLHAPIDTTGARIDPATSELQSAGNVTQTAILAAVAGTLKIASADARATGVTLSSALGSLIDIPINGQSIVALRFAGLTASGATISYFTSNDSTQAPASPVNDLNAGTGVRSPTRTTDGETRIPVSGRTTLRLQVTTAGAGSIAVSYNVGAAGTIVDIGSPLPPGTNITSAGDVALGAQTDAATASGANTSVVGALRAIRDKLLGTVAVTGTFWQATQPISGVLGTFVDGSDATQGAKADTAYAGAGSTSVVGALKGLYNALLAPTPTGTNSIGTVGLNAGSNLIGSVTTVPSTGSAVTTSQPTVTTTATALAFTGTAHREIYNLGSATIFIGASGVTTTTGYPIPPGVAYDCTRFAGTLYAIAASSQAAALISY